MVGGQFIIPSNSGRTLQPPQAHTSHISRQPIPRSAGDPTSLTSSTLTTASLRALNPSTTATTSSQSLAIATLPSVHRMPVPATFLQYPGAFYPAFQNGNMCDFKQFNTAQLQAFNAHAAFPTDLSKIKTPIINRNYLELAMLVCNTFRGKLFPCPHCRYVTDRRNNLKRHISTMHQTCDKVLECCGVTFGTKASLREHIMIFHHNGYSCPYCGRRFCRKALLKRHLSVHSGQKDFSCPNCDYATSHKSNLERHKRIHERLKSLDENKTSFVDVDTFCGQTTASASKPGNGEADGDLFRQTIDVMDSDISDNEEINVTTTEEEIEV
ncbi:zinc finger protein SNAI2-like [Saccostrea echinata]|uniref:zinc finger protein SNAI2-like n=1 Tax=Saccostrea echinata TaxID=191078 RepID=UPI002A82DE03|nr:zinc finger protein SNAI2-like [Saccostrea echinata]